MKGGIIGLALILVGGISGCGAHAPGPQQNVLNISANMEGECPGHKYGEGSLIIPIKDVTLPVDTVEEVYRIATQVAEYCNFNVSLDKASITRKEYSKTGFIRYFGESGRGEFSINEATGNIHRVGLVQPL